MLIDTRSPTCYLLASQLLAASRELYPRPGNVAVEPLGAEPAIAVWLELDLVLAALFGAAVVGPEQIDQHRRAGRGDRDADGARLVGEVVQHDQRVVAPV